MPVGQSVDVVQFFTQRPLTPVGWVVKVVGRSASQV
jgi:hypothetical protein